MVSVSLLFAVLPLQAAQSTSTIEVKVLDYASTLKVNAEKAVKYAAGSSGYWKYMGKALSAASNAWKIGQGLQDIAGSRDRRAEEAFQNGWENGITDAKRMWSNPRQAWIDVDWRTYYRKQGRLYEAAYSAGHAKGFEYEMKKHR